MAICLRPPDRFCYYGRPFITWPADSPLQAVSFGHVHRATSCHLDGHGNDRGDRNERHEQPGRRRVQVDSSGTHRLCGHRVVPRTAEAFVDCSFNTIPDGEAFLWTLLETAWPLLIGVLVSESHCPTLDCGLSSSSLRCWPGGFLSGVSGLVLDAPCRYERLDASTETSEMPVRRMQQPWLMQPP
jgi:hypothetical protein